jgi:hypothetical protein
MRKSPIKIKLEKVTTALSGGQPYRVKQLTGAITVWQDPVIRAGDYISEKTAESLTRAYQVTVTV